LYTRGSESQQQLDRKLCKQSIIQSHYSITLFCCPVNPSILEALTGRMNTEVRADKSIHLESIYVHVVQALSVFSRLVTASTHTSAHTCTYSKPPAHFCSANGLHTTT